MQASLTRPVLAEALGPQSGTALWVKRAVLVLLGIAALAIAAKIKLPMWPVPVTMGTFAVLGIGAAYGPRLGLVTILGYLLIGALGYDVFAGSTAQNAGLGYMVGFTGGYLVGYVLAVLALGALSERGWDRSVLWMALAMLIGNALIYVPGVLWLGQVWGWENPILLDGMIKFLPGDLLKLALAAMILPAAWKLIGSART